ncbi:MAG: class I SAM-dependent methyltransferase [Cohnella sp.]|nr:class I SAM-dependent methyltransferase [Cohnella sp.]
MSTNINVETWNAVYSEGRSLLQYPDEAVVTYLVRNKDSLKRGIDVACGAGRHTFLMAEMGLEAHGIDSSSASIAFATEKAARRGISNVNFANILAQDIQHESESFDIAIVWGLFHYLTIEDQAKVLSEVSRILKPGGKLLCTLRSSVDTRAEKGIEVEPNRYKVEYFDEDTKTPKYTLMYFWDEAGVRGFFRSFSDITMGHRTIEPMGKLANKTAHWLIAATK